MVPDGRALHCWQRITSTETCSWASHLTRKSSTHYIADDLPALHQCTSCTNFQRSATLGRRDGRIKRYVNLNLFTKRFQRRHSCIYHSKKEQASFESRPRRCDISCDPRYSARLAPTEETMACRTTPTEVSGGGGSLGITLTHPALVHSTEINRCVYTFHDATNQVVCDCKQRLEGSCWSS